MNGVLKTSDANAISSGSCDDEISLVELFHVLVKRRQTILSVFLAVFIGGVVFSLLMPAQYRYTTTIEIGTVLENGKTMLIDQPGTLRAKINEAYIPYVLERLAQEQAEGYRIAARIPKDSEVIVLESKAPETKGVTIINLQKQVVDHVKRNHQRVFDIIKKEINVELDKSKNKLSALQDRHKVLIADLERLDHASKLLTDQIKNLKALVADAIGYRKKARTQTGDETRAMTLLMIDNEIQQNNLRLAALEERFYIDLPREKDSLNNKVSYNLREQQEQAAEIAKVQAAVNNMRETRMLATPMRSAEPIGVKTTTIVVIAAISGLLLGIFAAFLTAFIHKARVEFHALDHG